MDKEYIKIQTDSFLFNAGIVGFSYLLQTVEAVKDVDYKIEANTLLVSKEYLLQIDLAQAYIDAHIEKFVDDANYTKMSMDIGGMKYLTEQYIATSNKELKKQLDDKYKYLFSNSGLLRASYLSGLASLAEKKIFIPIESMCKSIKAITDYQEKYQQLCMLKQQLDVQEVKMMLLMKDIIYSRINMIWSNKAFLNTSNAKKSIKDIYEKDFIAPLKKQLKNTKPITNKKAKVCIECGTKLSTVMEISFLNDTVDDMGRKKSSFWDSKPDAYLCPLCAFVYSLAPLGFESMGRNLIFINCNSSLDSLIRTNKSRKDARELNKENEKQHAIINTIIQEIIHESLLELINIQIIIRDKNNDCYRFSIIAKDLLETIQKTFNQLKFLRPFYIVLNDKHTINVYREVLDNILDRSNQYGLLNVLLKYALKENSSTYYLKNILEIQIHSLGGDSMDKIKDARNAFNRGYELRVALSGDHVGSQDADNKLRGFVYKLLNALQVNDREQYLNLVFRMYSSLNKPIPYIFINTFASEEEFKYLGYAFVLGLKNEKYNSKNNQEKEVSNND